ncbi:MAG: DUF1553 domain-containing protein [Bacteroidota bacterium]|nr:DUF1553 domain-containing protein [Bacteroidota bacterium]
MLKIKFSFSLFILLFVFLSCQEEKIDFSADVKPILNKRCISCHGGVKRSAEFSLLFRHEAIDTTESGMPSIIPGNAKHSEMIRRITSKDPDERMPYKEPALSDEEIRILTKWIDQGAEWGNHWAYVSPKKAEVPKPKTLYSGASKKEWAINDIDHFILDKLEKENIVPAAQADKATLLRRVYLDLIGLPPTPEQAEKFFNDDSPDAYEKIVDELLASPHYGEKWASWWLDLARFADTKGYERDVGRNIWRYRDYVINAFNKDLSFDQFTIEQLAGDLLPDPTDEQLLATAFHRNTMNNDEGGTEDEEYRVAATIDRVNTTWEVWQSTTMSCVQCHTHPYDPFLHEDFYTSLAIFNNTRDEDTEGEHPNLRIFKEEDEKKLTAIKEWVKDHEGPDEEKKVARFLKTLEPKYHPHSLDEFIDGELIDTKWLGVRPGGSARLPQIKLDGKEYLIVNYWMDVHGGSFEVRKGSLKGEVIAIAKLEKTQGRKAVFIPLKPTQGTHDLFFVFSHPKIKKDQSVCAIEWFAFQKSLPGKGDPGHIDVQQYFISLLNVTTDNTPVLIENEKEQHRKTYVFDRGNWMVHGEEVTPGVPASLNAFPEDKPKNRLGFAHWLLQKDNPLTARTMVNRFWEQIFGTGIVETLEDLGTQATQPTHQELLDYLALQFMNDYNWSMKKLLKEIVSSAAYRQDSRVSNDILEKDPANRLLSRGPRVRLTSEQIKDQSLAVSGLLSNKMFGPSVMPYQPEGIWNSVWSGEYWKTSEGEDQHRRAVYTFIKRTSPYPSMMMFDGSSREVCVSRRIRTNTPLQALVTLNDSSYVVAARHLAKKMMKDELTPKDQIAKGYKIILVKDIPEKKLDVLVRLYEDAKKKYLKDIEAGKLLIAEDKANPDYAAMTVVANTMLNLDEVLTKE